MDKRIVITGLGLVTPIGIGKEEYWSGVVQGRSGIGVIKAFDTSKHTRHNGGEVREFFPGHFMADESAAKMGRGAQFAVACSKMAVADARVDLETLDKDRIGVFLGTTDGEAQVIQRIHDKVYIENHEEGVEALCVQYPAFQMNASIAREFGIRGDNLMIPNACAAGNFAIGYAYDLIRTGKLDYAFAGGSDTLSRMAYTGFARLLAMAHEKVQPFDLNRKGMMVSEGAATLFIETLESAKARNAHIYAEVIGYGVSCDAYHMTTPHPEGKGILLAMTRAVESAGILPEDVDYVSPHGTGTNANDKVETLTLKAFFGERYKEVPVSSIKSMIGHTMGAASAIEAATCALVIDRGIIPPTINYETPDPECDLDCVPNHAREKQVRVVMNNAYAFGGNNSCLILRKVEQ